jgi:hypothetical protein
LSYIFFDTKPVTAAKSKVVTMPKKRTATANKSIKTSKWFAPYYLKNGDKLPALNMCWECQKSGIYFIRKKSTGNIVYIGQSQTQLKKTIYRHFQKWTDKQRSTNKHFERKTYPKFGYEIRFLMLKPSDALRLEAYLIQKIQPVDNPLKYEHLTKDEIIKGQLLDEKAKQAWELPTEEYSTNLEVTPF